MGDTSAQLAALQKCAASPACGADTLLDLASTCKGATLMRCLASLLHQALRTSRGSADVWRSGGKCS